MQDWYDPLSGATDIAAHSPDALAAWPDNAFADEVQQLAYCAVGLSELLVVAQMLPLEIVHSTHGPQLVANLKTNPLRSPAFDASGAWRFAYKPLALRILPFVTFADGSTARLPAPERTPDLPRTQALQQSMSGILARSAQDTKRLGALVAHCFEAGFLEWPDGDGAAVETGRYLRGAEETELTLDQAPTYRLLTALEFSLRKTRLRARRVHNQEQKHSNEADQEAVEVSFLSFDQGLWF